MRWDGRAWEGCAGRPSSSGSRRDHSRGCYTKVLHALHARQQRKRGALHRRPEQHARPQEARAQACSRQAGSSHGGGRWRRTCPQVRSKALPAPGLASLVPCSNRTHERGGAPRTAPVACGQLGVRSPARYGRKVTPWDPGGSSAASAVISSSPRPCDLRTCTHARQQARAHVWVWMPMGRGARPGQRLWCSVGYWHL